MAWEIPRAAIDVKRLPLSGFRTNTPIEAVVLEDVADVDDSLACFEKMMLLQTPGVRHIRIARCALDSDALVSLGVAIRSLSGCSVDAGGGHLSGVEPEECAPYDLLNNDDATTVATDSSLLTRSGNGMAGISETPASGGSMLRTLAIVNCSGPPAEAWSALWRHLPAGLCELNLSGNALSDHAVSSLCGALRNQGSPPRRLTLSSNRCKDIERLCGLVSISGVEELDLSDNYLNNTSAVQLSEVLSSSASTLWRLILSHNRRLSSIGLAELAEVLPRSRLQHLALDGTSLCDEGAEVLATVLPNCCLSHIQIERAMVSDRGVERLLAATQGLPAYCELTFDEPCGCMPWVQCASPDDVLLVVDVC